MSIYETMPTVLRSLETAATLRDRVELDGDPLELPEGAYVIQSPGVGDLTIQDDRREGGVAYSTRADGNRLLRAAASPVELSPDALDRAAWMQEWSIEVVERTFGPNPVDSAVESTSVWVALLPTHPPRIYDGEESRRAVSVRADDFWHLESQAREAKSSKDPGVDRRAYVAGVIAALAVRRVGPPNEPLSEALASQSEGLSGPGWVAVLCREDGSADYYLLPTAAHAEVTNAGEFCSRIESRLDDIR